jgi:hypothetical protein
MSKIKLAAVTALGASVAAVLGIFAGIMVTHGPAAPTPAQTPAGFVQPYVAGDPVDPTTTTDTTTAPVDTSTAAPVVPPPTVATTTTIQPAAPANGDPVPGAPINPANGGVVASPIMPTTTTVPVPFCLPDASGATICN